MPYYILKSESERGETRNKKRRAKDEMKNNVVEYF
jgi:hypothetical protein